MSHKIPVNTEELYKLGGLHATQDEVAAWFGMSATLVDKKLQSRDTYEFQGRKLTFREIWEEGRAKGRTSLRRKQMELALAGDKTMLIWLGKQVLGQRDKTETQVSGPGGKPLLDLASVRAFMHGDKESDE